jgi:hypothetical protein
MSLRPSILVSLLLATLAIHPRSARAQAGPWEPVRNDDGIVVHRRTVAGSKLHEFRGVGVVEATIASILAVLDDAPRRTEWMKEAVANSRVERVGEYGEIFYSRTGAPWPVADRDVVNLARTTFDPSARQVRVEFTSTTHPAWPPQKGVVRMPSLRGHWTMTPEHGGAWTRIEYQLHADPGGLLPTWIVNMVSRKLPHDTIMGVRQQVRRRHYPEFEKQLAANPDYAAIVSPITTSSADALTK